MVQKIFDVSPPQKSKTERKIVKKIIFSAEDKKKKKRENPLFQLPKFSLKPFFIFLFFFFFLGIFFFLPMKFNKTEIKIWPIVEEINTEGKITVDTNADKMDIKGGVIRGKIFEIEESFSNEFEATGKKLKKAEGTIRLFNEYKTENELWRAGTRFVSSEGKLFVSKEKISVPGAKIESGKIKASYVDVPVEAGEGGAEYNIGPSDFSIIIFKGDPRYFKYYGKSFEPMKGGGEFPVITAGDLAEAEKSLIEKAKERAIEVLKNRIPQDYLISEEAILIEILDKSSSAKEGEEREKFLFQAKLKIKAIVFSKKELEEFSQQYFINNLSPEKAVYLPSLSQEYKTEVVNFDLGKMTLFLKIFAKVYFPLDPLSLKKGLAEKRITEAEQILLNHPQIAKSQIRIFPFWTKRISSQIDQIDLIYPIID